MDMTHAPAALPKSATGIAGLDEITGGGLPRGRPTLVCGGPGCGKTLLAAEFLVRGAVEFDEPGVFVVFEETAADVMANVASLGFDLAGLVAEGKLYIDHVRVERHEIEEAGEYDLEGLFVRLGHAIGKVGAKRVALDTIETLFAGFNNQGILRAELKRLFQWLKDRGVTAVITAERGATTLSRHGLEEYVSDCVILLDHRVNSQVSTRRLRIVKYRGSMHGTNEYPFLIDEGGFTVVPITSTGLDHPANNERISLGIAGVDEMLGGGVFRGSTLLVSGTAGTGKTTTAAHFADASCRRGEGTLYFAFEESPTQITRNLRSVALDLAPHVESGLLRFLAARPTVYGLEMHLAKILRAVEQFAPHAVVLDPITALLGNAPSEEVRTMITRLIDSLKAREITALFTTLVGMGDPSQEQTDLGISSLVDTWLLLRDIELNGERNRGLYILKSRGMAHSNQIREFVITSNGVHLVPAYVGSQGIFTGTARVTQEARARAAEMERRQELERLRRQLAQKRAVTETQIAALRLGLEADEAEFESALEAEAGRQQHAHTTAGEIARSRHAAEYEEVPVSGAHT
jgi:circadian clock protein KaiC